MKNDNIRFRTLALLSALALSCSLMTPNHIMADDPCEPEWDQIIGQPGMDDRLRTLTVFDDGAGTALYAGGTFTTAGGAEASLIAKWNGVSWSPLGSGMSGPAWIVEQIRALAEFDDGSGPALYAGGFFDTAGGVAANNIAKWDDSSWSPVGLGVGDDHSGWVNALTVFDDGSGPSLYAGGRFTQAGGQPVNRIAEWDGSEWSPLGSGVSGGSPVAIVNALTTFDDGSGESLYVGGTFIEAGGETVNHIAKWDGESWSALDSGMNDDVVALAVFDDGTGPALYAGGRFTQAGGVDANYIAKWDGSSWSSLGSGVSHGSASARVWDLLVFDEVSGPLLYVGGRFTTAGAEDADNIATWDGSAWSSVEPGVNDDVRALAAFDDGSGPALYAGGDFTVAGGEGANRIAAWTGCPLEPKCAFADLNCDGVVNVLDLLLLLEAWGTCADPDDCPADLNGDGVVNVLDLLILLENWG